MINSFMQTSFCESNSFFFRFHPATKLIYLILANIFIILNKNLYCLLLFVLINLLLVFSIKENKKTRNSFIIVGLTFAITMFLFYILMFGFSYPLIIRTILRILGFILPVTFLIISTNIQKISYGIEFILYPLTYLRVPINAFVLTFTIAISFIPIILEECNRILYSMAGRGDDIRIVSFYKKIKIIINLLVPLLIASINKATTLAYSIQNTGYSIKSKRTNIYAQPFKFVDYISLFFIIVLFVCVIPFMR